MHVCNFVCPQHRERMYSCTYISITYLACRIFITYSHQDSLTDHMWPCKSHVWNTVGPLSLSLSLILCTSLLSLRLHISPPSLTWYFYHFILSPYYSFNCGPPAAVHSVCVSLVPSCSPTFISTLWGHSFYSCLLVPESRVEQETESKHTFRLEVFIFVIPGHKPFQAPYFNIAT